MRSDLLTVQEAAAICGVSTSTFKRICEAESVPLARTPGGHRRIERGELQRVAKLHFPARYLRIDTPSLDGFSKEAVLAALMDGHASQLARMFAGLSRNPIAMIRALEEHFVPALWQLGEWWRSKRIDIYQERICSDCALAMLDSLRQQLGGSSFSSLAVGGALNPNRETIPSKLVALCFDLMGVRAVDLGGCVPAGSIAKAAQDLGASRVWVTHTHVEDVDSLMEGHVSLRDLLPSSTRIIIGGGGLSPALRRALSGCRYYETLLQMLSGESLVAAA